MERLDAGISALNPGKAIGLDNIATEEIRNFGPEIKIWLLQLYNQYLATHKLPKIWKKAHVTALLKSGKDSCLPKYYHSISLLSHTYKLFERLILNRVAPVIDEHLISEQAGFRPGKSTTSQVINLTQDIEDGFVKGMVTGTVFVDLSAAYDTVNHRCLHHKIQELTEDIRLTKLIGSILENIRFFFFELGVKKSRWRKLKNGLSPHSHSTYTNDQPRGGRYCTFHLCRRSWYCSTGRRLYSCRRTPLCSLR